jgi:glycosyltransferase involved in cell wall biosynthesis
MERKLYFVTLNWHTTQLLKDMVASVEETTPQPHTWIIVDNGSDDENWRELKRWAQKRGLDNGEHGYLHRYDTNQGLIVAHNRALDLAALCRQPHDVVLINTDVTVYEEGWLGKVWAWTNDRPHVGMIGLEHNAVNACASAIFLDPLGYWYVHEEQPTRAEPVEAESVGFGMVLLRWPVLEAGLRFDDLYLMYYKQDDDLAFQMRSRLGLEVWTFPIGCDHWGSGSIKINGPPGGKESFERIKRRNQAVFAERWAWALRPRRPNMAAEAEHLAKMRRVMWERRRYDAQKR